MKHLVLLGCGHAHVHVLSTLASRPVAGAQISLVAPHPHQLYSGMMPGFVAGHYALEECLIQLQPFLKHSGVRWHQASAADLDAQDKTILLDDGTELRYDALSINTGALQNRAQIETVMPGATEHALFVRPIDKFATLWPEVEALAQAQALRLTVVGGGAAGVELALAIKHRLQSASVTLVTGGSAPATNYSPKVQQQVYKTLKHREITVIEDAVVGIREGEVLLRSGASLACDVPVLATGAQAPVWLKDSGLALDDNGFVEVDACQRSTSHSCVFAAGDVSTRVDSMFARSGVYAVRAGPLLSRNLRALVANEPLQPHQPRRNTLNLISCGRREAIASWGPYCAQGRWLWWLKNWIDRGFVSHYNRVRRPAT